MFEGLPPRVNILHCGGEEETSFIEHLERISSNGNMPVQLGYTKFTEGQNKGEIMLRDAGRYENEKLPVIVLISKFFFHLVWAVAAQKQGIVRSITSGAIKYCVHVWLDVSEEDVHVRSNILLREELSFCRVKLSELRQFQDGEMIYKIQVLLEESGDRGHMNDIDNNETVDDSVEDMRVGYENAYVAANGEPAPKVTVAQGNSKRGSKKKKKVDTYKEALRMAAMDEDELNTYLKNKES